MTTSSSVTTVQRQLPERPEHDLHHRVLLAEPRPTRRGSARGKTFAGSTTVTTNASGFKAAISAATTSPIPSGGVVTATATDPNGNTSEFSNDTANAPPTVDLAVALVASPTDDDRPGRADHLRLHRRANFGASGATNVVLTEHFALRA